MIDFMGGVMETAHTNHRPIIAWVEDDSDFQEVVREWLLPKFDLRTYRNGETFLDRIDDVAPDVIMLDIGLPGLGGLGINQRLRRRKRFACVPILFLSSRMEEIDFINQLGPSITAFLRKPVARSDLLETLSRLIPSRHREPALAL